MTNRPAIRPLTWKAGWVNYVEYANTLFGEHYAVRTNLDGKWGWRKPGCVAFTWIGGTKDEAKAAAQSDYEAHIRSCLLDKPEAVEGEKPEEVVANRPEWIWYCESTSGIPVVTFGRWPKHPQQVRYKLAEIQPTEHDHPPPPAAPVRVTEKMVEAAWQAYQSCPIDLCDDYDKELKKAVAAAVDAAFAAKEQQPSPTPPSPKPAAVSEGGEDE